MAQARKSQAPPVKSDFVTTRTPVEISEHLDSEQWATWPTRARAHPEWGVRQRQVDALITKGKLVLYRCPDNTLRLDPKALTSHFGEPGVFQGRERDAPMVDKRARRQAVAREHELQGLVDDPLPGMFRVVCGMLTDLRGQQKDMFEMMTKPLKAAADERDQVMARLMTRLETLEARELEQLALVAELSDMKHARELQLREADHRQANRQAVINQLKDHWPDLKRHFLSGPSAGAVLGGFVKGLKPELQAMLEPFFESLVNSGELSAEQTATLRAALPKKPTTSTANGAAQTPS